MAVDFEQANLIGKNPFYAIVEAIGDGVVVVDNSGIVQFVNPAACLLLGCSADDGVGKSFEFPLVQGPAIEIKLNGPERVGEIKFVQTLLEDEPIYIATIRDITRRKQMEESLEKERQKLFSVFERLPAFIYLQTSDYSIPFANQKFREIFGNPESRRCYEILKNRQSPCRDCRTLDLLKNRSPLVWEWTDAQNRTYMIYDNIFTMPDRVDALLEIGIEITERKHAEKALAKEMAMNAALAELSANLIAKASMDDIASRILKHAKEFTNSEFGFVGYQEPDGERLTTIKDGWEKNIGDETNVLCKSFSRLWEWALTNQKPLMTNSAEQDLISVGGPETPTVKRFLSAPVIIGQTLVGQIALANGQRDYVKDDLKIIQRLTALYSIAAERKRAEEKLAAYGQELEKLVEERTKTLKETQEKLLCKEKLAAIGQLAGSVGHELRNPLGVIANSLYYLKAKLRNSDEIIQKHLNILQNQLNRIDKIIADILDFAKTKMSSLGFDNVNAIIEDALSTMIIPENIHVQMGFYDKLPLIAIDGEQMRRAFINIIANAIQAMPEGGKLEIRTAKKNQTIEIVFQDAGQGIPKERLEKVFEPLFTTKAKGVGLGLAIAKDIVANHRGKIEIESVVGKMTCVVITLPIGL